MEVRDQLHVPAALPPGKAALVPINRTLDESQSHSGHQQIFWRRNVPINMTIILVIVNHFELHKTWLDHGMDDGEMVQTITDMY
jgi:hypothetical protein